jgi:hypothetical protein
MGVTVVDRSPLNKSDERLAAGGNGVRTPHKPVAGNLHLSPGS